MKDKDTVRIELDTETNADGVHKPTMHVLMPDGESLSFKERSLLISEECGEENAGQAVMAVLVNGKGEVWHDATTGEPCIVDVPPLYIRNGVDPDQMITAKEAAATASTHRDTIGCAIKAGQLEKFYAGGRHPRIKQADLEMWMLQRKYGR